MNRDRDGGMLRELFWVSGHTSEFAGALQAGCMPSIGSPQRRLV